MKNKTDATKVTNGTETFIRVPLGLIVRSRTNPRKTFETPDWPEFVENVRTFGVLQPGLARPLPGRDEGEAAVELVAGERRFRASQAAGLADMPLIIRDLTDAEVREIQQVENLQREDLQPLEEAQGFADWCAALRLGQTMTTEEAVAHICAKIGKKRTHVFGRRALLKVTGPVRDALAAGKLEVTKAQLIASVPVPEDQEALLARALEENWAGDRMSYRQLQRRIEQDYRIKLKGAPFELHEVFDVEALTSPIQMTSCEACQFRTGNMGLDGDENVCTKPECFRAKTAAVLEREAELKGKTTVLSEKQMEKLEYDGEHVASDAVCYLDAERRTWGEILGKHKPSAQVGLVIEEGEPKVREFYDGKEAQKVAQEKKLIKPFEEKEDGEESEATKQWKKEQAERKASLAAKQAVVDENIKVMGREAALSWPVEWLGQHVDFWRKLALTVLEVAEDYGLEDSLLAGRGLTVPDKDADDEAAAKALRDYIMKQPSEPNLIGLVMDLLVVPQSNYGEDGGVQGRILKVWGLDINKAPALPEGHKYGSTVLADGHQKKAKGKKEKKAAKAKPAAIKPAVKRLKEAAAKASAKGKGKKK